MRKFISTAIVIAIAGSSIFMACKKENNENKEPVLPPAESMVMDFSNFQSSTKKSLATDDTSAYNNWTSSAVTVGIWNVVAYLNSAVPVAAFKESFNHPSVLVENSIWRRSFSISSLGATYTCKLDGEANGNSSDWKMYLSKTNGLGANFTDFLWFTGTSSNNGSTATWHINRGPEFSGRKYFDANWVKNTSLRYTIVDTYEVGVGNYLEYKKINEAGLDAQFLIQTVDHSYDIDIQWNTTDKNGRVKCTNWYNDLNWHCWGINYKNSICN